MTALPTDHIENSTVTCYDTEDAEIAMVGGGGHSKVFFLRAHIGIYTGVMGCGAAETTSLGFVFVFFNPRLLSANRVDFGLMNFPILLPTPFIRTSTPFFTYF